MIKSYKELTLAKWEELRNIDLEQEEIDIQVQMIAVLCGDSEDNILNLPITEYSNRARNLEFLSKAPEGHNRCPRHIRINGKEYDILRNIQDMTAGQYIDYQNYLAKDDADKWLPYILTTFITPKGKKYGEVDVMTVKDEIEEGLSVEDAMTIARFFFRKSQSLIVGTLTYLEWKTKKSMRKMPKEMKEKTKEALEKIQLLKDSVRNGVGYTPQS